MRKKLLYITMLAFSAVGHAQDFWTFTQVFQDNWYHVADINIVDESTVWVIGTNYDETDSFGDWKWGLSTDGGLTWTSGFLPDDSPSPYSSDYIVANIVAISDQTAYVAAPRAGNYAQNKILVTHDSGSSWSQIHPELFTGTNSWIAGIHFFDENNGVAYGDTDDGYFEIYTTTDAAATWARTPAANIPATLPGELLYAGKFDVTAGIFRFTTNGGRMFKSVDQGLHWTVSMVPLNANLETVWPGYIITQRFAFKNASEGVFVNSNNLWFNTTDGGETWNPYIPAGPALNLGVSNVPQTSGTYYSTGKPDEEGIWQPGSYSTTNANNWISGGSDGFRAIRTEFFSSEVGYASGFRDTDNSNYHGFYRLTDPLNRLLKNKSFLETNISAAPNPATNQITFSANGISAIELFDVFGKQISQRSFSAVNEVQINTQELQTGIYFAKVTTDSGMQTLKIVKK